MPLVVIDVNAVRSELTEDALAFTGKNFLELNCEFIEEHSDAIYGFSPESFCYYLPGILIAGVREGFTDLLAYSSILGMLDRSNTSNTWNNFFVHRWCNMKQAEYAAILDWLMWLSESSADPYQDDQIGRSFDTINVLMNEHESVSIARGNRPP